MFFRTDPHIMKFGKPEFEIEEVHRCKKGLKKIASEIKRGRITAKKIRKLGVIRLGTMLVGSGNFGSLYTTDHPSVMARCWLPYTGGLIWLEGDHGLEHQQSWVVDLHRLQSIKQLSLLCFPVKQGSNQHSIDFRHTRFMHTYDVISIGLLCAHNTKVAGNDLLALTIALAIHDAFTPSCGDLMKFVNYEKYDEDEQLSTLMNHKPYLKMCEELGIKPEEPIRICQEKNGLLCQIRDFADTLAYTARDLSMFLEFFGMCPPPECGEHYEDPEDQLLLEEVYKYRQDNGDFALLWEDVETDSEGNLVFTDAERLHTFLRVRAIMFRILYYNRQTRNIEYLLGIRMVKLLLEENILGHNQFIGELSDENAIWWKIFETTGYNPSYLHNGALGMTYEFTSLELARRYVQKESNDQKCGLIYQWPSATKSKVNYWKVKCTDGRILPWGEAYPEQAAEIEKIMWQHHGWFVSIIHREHLHEIHPKYWDKLKQLEQSAL